MNSFYRVCIMICLFMLAFTLVANFVISTGAFGDTEMKVSLLDEPDMAWMWAGVVGLSFAGVVLLAWMTHSVIPIGLHIFSTIFWTSWVNMTYIFEYGGASATSYLPGEFILIFTAIMVFVFVAAVIGMLTGSG